MPTLSASYKTYDLDLEQSLFCSKIRRENERDGMRDIRATYGSRLRILRWHADVVSSSSFRVSLRIFEQKRDCSQSTYDLVCLLTPLCFVFIKFGQKTNEEKETEQFDGEVCEFKLR